jgi:succinylarginine dihydrolase
MKGRVHIIVQNVEKDLHQSLECMVIGNYIQDLGCPDVSIVARSSR